MTRDEFEKRFDELTQEMVNLIYGIMKAEDIPFSMLDLTILAPKDENPQVAFGLRTVPKETLAVAVTKDGRLFAMLPNDEKQELDSAEEARKQSINAMLNDIIAKGDKSNGTN